LEQKSRQGQIGNQLLHVPDGTGRKEADFLKRITNYEQQQYGKYGKQGFQHLWLPD
jgi:hypothetical protein